ncbi:hypothetical protein GHT06_009050 [Daphnia sinensis]|uniref:Uncharacterized protein n=1 Tax=Daphnia sinensis TaxID=1820382 RepID=A0AAD5LNF0_9CRUS|nr:hypothetical protein GHT06_009050 [Daphnia sinensis]
MKSFTEIITRIALSMGFIEYDPVDDETPYSENPDIATQENNFQPPAQVPDDPIFRYVPSPPLCSNRPVYQANSDVIIDMPADDKPHGIPDSNTRYGFSLGLTGTSDKKYWNDPPYVFVPPPYRPTVSYVPPPRPEHLEADRFEKREKIPATEMGDEDLIDLFTELHVTYGFCVQDELDRMREKVTQLSRLLQEEQMKNFDLRQLITKLEAEKEEMSRANLSGPCAYPNDEIRANQHQAWVRRPPQNVAEDGSPADLDIPLSRLVWHGPMSSLKKQDSISRINTYPRYNATYETSPSQIVEATPFEEMAGPNKWVKPNNQKYPRPIAQLDSSTIKVEERANETIAATWKPNPSRLSWSVNNMVGLAQSPVRKIWF